MTEIVARDEALPATTTIGPDPTGGRLIAWADGLTAAHRIGTALCNTAFAPAHFKGKPEDAAAAILFGDEIGLSPTQALRSIFVISGQPSLYARVMVALVLHHGHEVWTVEKSDSKVTVAGKRVGSQHVIEETWTVVRATKAGYTNNKKYTTDPQAMLYARAAADVCRQIAPDALAGLAYTVEEMELTEPPTVSVVRTTERPTTAKRKPLAPVPVPEPDFDPPARDDDPPHQDDAEPELRSEAQSRKLFATAREAGISADELRPFMASILGREVESSKTLTRTEAGQIIEALEAAKDQPDTETGELPLDGELVNEWPPVAGADQ